MALAEFEPQPEQAIGRKPCLRPLGSVNVGVLNMLEVTLVLFSNPNRITCTVLLKMSHYITRVSVNVTDMSTVLSDTVHNSYSFFS